MTGEKYKKFVKAKMEKRKTLYENMLIDTNSTGYYTFTFFRVIFSGFEFIYYPFYMIFGFK